MRRLRLVLLVLLFLGFSRDFVSASETLKVDKTVNLKVGQMKEVELKECFGKDVRLTSISYLYVEGTDTLFVDVNAKSIFFYGKHEGQVKVSVNYFTKSGVFKTKVFGVTVRGTKKGTLTGNLCSMSGVFSSIKTKDLQYKKCYFIQFDSDADGKRDLLYFVADSVVNRKSGEFQPKVKLIFYDKDKKKIASFDSSTVYLKDVSTEDEYKEFACAISAKSLGISKKQWSKIKYWRVVS